MEAHMRRSALIAFGILALVITVPATSLRATRAHEEDTAGDSTTAATLANQVELAVTVYNSNIALVRDVRQLALPSGQTDLQLADIAASVNPATVHFRSLSEPSKLSVLEQNYEYDLLDPERLLKKYVGRDVTLVRTQQRRGTTRERIGDGAPARLQRRAGLADRQRNRDRLRGRAISLPRDPRNLHSRPTLVWTLENSGAHITASRRRTLPATCPGAPTTCSPSAATTSTRTSTDG